MFDQALQRRIVAALDANPHVENPTKSTEAVRTANAVPGVRTVDDQLSPRRGRSAHQQTATAPR